MINLLIEECDVDLAAGPATPARRAPAPATTAPWPGGSPASRPGTSILPRSRRSATRGRAAPGPGARDHRHRWSGKSSLTDELIRRFRLDQEDKLSIAVLAVDPTRRRGGGALLGDRIRMNAIDAPTVFFRSLATRGSRPSCPTAFPPVMAACAPPASTWSSWRPRASARATPPSTDIVDVSLYVMTPEFGAASQLEKIDMLEFADVVAINKFDRRGAEDALRDVCRQWGRDHRAGAGRRGRSRCSAPSPPASTTTA